MRQNNNETNRSIPEKMDVDGKKVFVLSDLHMAAGLKRNGNYDGTENFYADDSFARFLGHLQQNLNGRGGMLIINGDFIDFLRICSYPDSADDFRCWREILEQVGINKTAEELRNSIVDKERTFGLKTHDYKSVWKLYVCINGHKAFFKQLAQWVYNGNDLIILKGNHDLEWHWPAVQQYLQVALEKLVADDEHLEGLRRSMKNRIRFIADSLLLNNRVYIEHGHLFEKITRPKGEPTINNNTELNLPFGSFLNRYLINQFELSYPFLDNVRPTPNILKVLLKENFTKALQVITWELPRALRLVPRRYAGFILQYLLPLLLLIVFPVVSAIVTLVILRRNGGFDGPFLSGRMIGSLVLCAVAYFIVYYLGKGILSLLIKKEPAFSKNARQILEDHPSVEAVLFGHTHDPEQNNLVGKDGDSNRKHQWYFNTGTWIPVFETSSANVRLDKTYTFITVDLTEEQPCRERLQRWNDDAERVDTMIINDKK